MTIKLCNPTAVKEKDHILPCANAFTYWVAKVTTDSGTETDRYQADTIQGKSSI